MLVSIQLKISHGSSRIHTDKAREQ